MSTPQPASQLSPSAENSSRVIADLRELAALTSTPDGSQRVAWGPVWRTAREWLRAKLAPLNLQLSTDPAGNLWATLPGTSDKTVIVGSHVDSVPNGGWLDGALGVVLAPFGLHRAILRFVGQAAHARATRINLRRDAFLAAASTALECREIARRHSKPGAGVVCTTGVVKVEPGFVTAIPGAAEISVDQRALDANVLAAMVREAQEASRRFAAENNVTVEWTPLFSIEPRPFDPQLLQLCEESVREITGDAPKLPSGPLHDAAQMALHMPAVMMFTYSARGLSHCKEEDTPIAHLEPSIRAFLLLVDKTVAHVSRP